MDASLEDPSPSGTPEQRYRVMGDYLLLERIAVGGMGEVWLSKRKNDDGTFGELRAVKFLHAKHAANPEVVSMFVEEARLASRLEHASVSRLYELGRDEDTYYIAMEHLFGRDLLAVLRRARDKGVAIPPPLVAMIGQRVAEALDAARHAIGDDGEALDIVHRDVSPQNIVLGFDGRVKLIDFGIARTQSAVVEGAAKARSKKVHGKLGYVSPEQAQGKAVDHKSDQFSLGICLWELLVLRPLFRRQSDSATLDDVVRARVPPVRSKVPTCPVELAAIVEKMLQKDPEARFPEAADVAAALSSFLMRLPEKTERQDLVTFVRKLFDEDYARDRMRLDALELVGRETVRSSDVTPPRGLPAMIAKSIATSSLFDDDDNPHEQQTTIFPDAGPLAQRAEREVFFRRDSVASRNSDPGGSSPRGPVHATFRPGRAGAAEVWRPPASDLIESMAAFEDPALAEERDDAPFEAEGPFAGRELENFESVPPPERISSERTMRPSERPAAPSDLPTRTELERISRDLDGVASEFSGERAAPLGVPLEATKGLTLPPPPNLPRKTPTPSAPYRIDRARGGSEGREGTQPVTTPTRKLASLPPPPQEESAPSSSRALWIGAFALVVIFALTYYAWIELGLGE